MTSNIFVSYTRASLDPALVKKVLNLLHHIFENLWLDHEARLLNDATLMRSIYEAVDRHAMFLVMLSSPDDVAVLSDCTLPVVYIYMNEAQGIAVYPPEFFVGSETQSGMDLLREYLRWRGSAASQSLFARIEYGIQRHQKERLLPDSSNTNYLGIQIKKHMALRHTTLQSLAEALDMDEELLKYIVDGHFPVEELSHQTLHEIAELLECSLEELGLEINSHDQKITNRSSQLLFDLPASATSDNDDVMQVDDIIAWLRSWRTRAVSHDLQIEKLLSYTAQTEKWAIFEEVCFAHPLSSARSLLKNDWQLADDILKRIYVAWSAYAAASELSEFYHVRPLEQALAKHGRNIDCKLKDIVGEHKRYWVPLTFEVQDNVQQNHYMFWIARLPITEEQYRVFLRECSQNKRDESDRCFRDISEPHFDQWLPKGEMLEQTPEQFARVSAASAIKFCEWLTHRLQNQDYHFRLLTEHEWIEVANLRLHLQAYSAYSGEEQPIVELAHTLHSATLVPLHDGIEHPSWLRLVDIDGNVWEWTDEINSKGSTSTSASRLVQLSASSRTKASVLGFRNAVEEREHASIRLCLVKLLPSERAQFTRAQGKKTGSDNSIALQLRPDVKLPSVDLNTLINAVHNS